MRHLRTLLQGATIVTNCRRQGIEPDALFYDALEQAIGKAGAALIEFEARN